MDLIEAYEQYQDLRTSAPKIFATHLFIQLLGHSLGRKSHCRIQPASVRHNTYLGLNGPSGVTKKTTAQSTVLRPLIPLDNLGNVTFSPQGLLRDLEEKPQLICPLGEFSTLLRGIKTGGYVSEFKEIANDLFTCPEAYIKRLAKKKDSYTVNEPYLSMNTTCTEEEFFPNLTPDVVHGGFLPRWIMVFGESKYRDRGELAPIVDTVEEVFQRIIRKCYNNFRSNPLTFVLDTNAKTLYNRIARKWCEDPAYEDVQPFVARYQNYLITYADIIAVSEQLTEGLFTSLTQLKKLSQLTQLTDLDLDKCVTTVNRVNRPVLQVHEEHIMKAHDLILPSLLYAKKIVKYVDEDLIVARLTRVIDKFGLPTEYSVAMRRCKLNANQMRLAVFTLVGRKELELKTVQIDDNRVKQTLIEAQYAP